MKSLRAEQKSLFAHRPSTLRTTLDNTSRLTIFAGYADPFSFTHPTWLVHDPTTRRNNAQRQHRVSRNRFHLRNLNAWSAHGQRAQTTHHGRHTDHTTPTCIACTCTTTQYHHACISNCTSTCSATHSNSRTVRHISLHSRLHRNDQYPSSQLLLLNRHHHNHHNLPPQSPPQLPQIAQPPGINLH